MNSSPPHHRDKNKISISSKFISLLILSLCLSAVYVKNSDSNLGNAPGIEDSITKNREQFDFKGDKNDITRNKAKDDMNADLFRSKSEITHYPNIAIKNITLLGERNSGTTWMSAQLERCFPRLEVRHRLLRHKHWFQDDDGLSDEPTLVIAQFRNIYEWVEAMRAKPIHIPEHLYLDWKTFVSKEWTMPRPKRDLMYQNSTERLCSHQFRYDQVISCVKGSKDDEEYIKLRERIGDRQSFNAHKPIYEMKPSGLPFENILEMRAAKIRNFLNVSEFPMVDSVISVKYESLVRKGTDFLLQEIERRTGMSRECEPVPSQTRKRRQLSKEYVRWLNENVDWEAEGLIGYRKMKESDWEAPEEISDPSPGA